MIFFTSDHHFGHENIIKHCRRPFPNADAMDDYMVAAWNSTVGPDDDVYHLGDFSHKRCPADRANAIASSLNGNIHLILGNHETDNPRGLQWDSHMRISERLILNTQYFSSLNEGYFYLRIEGRIIVMSHYALQTWHDMRAKPKPTWHLHGHSHGKLAKVPRRLDVGVDDHDFKPWSLEDITNHFTPTNKRKNKPPTQEKLETVF